MFKRKVSLLLASILILSNLSGCSSSSEINELNNLESSNVDTGEAENTTLSYAEEQDLIYAQVSDRMLLDVEGLDRPTDNDIQEVKNYMNAVDEQLIGNTPKNEYVLDECFSNYLLAFFENTPYYWQRRSQTIKGQDSESKSVVVDVTYKTIDMKKDVKKDSKIVKGDPNYEDLMKNRYNRYVTLLNAEVHQSPDLDSLRKKFIDIYGEPKEIYKSQENLTLTEEIYEHHNQLTYKGMVNSREEKGNATVTVRFVLVPKKVLGIRDGINCEHMYITDYELDTDPTEDKEVTEEEGTEKAVDEVYATLYSYFNCIDESDFNGLYKLTTDFEKLDKYFNDLFETTYSKHENFTLSVFKVLPESIECGVTIASKSRAIGSKMTYPSYTDRYFFELALVDDIIKVKNMVLLSRKIQGEPKIITHESEDEGFIAEITLSNEDKQAIEDLICKFGVLQLNKDTSSDSFGDVVDLSIDRGDLSTLQKNMTSVSGNEKVVWLDTYRQGSSNSASVRCTEDISGSDGIRELSSIYNFITKGGRWYISGYSIGDNNKLNITELGTTNSLCVVNKSGVQSYTSQVVSTSSSSDSDDADDLTESESSADISITDTFDEYIPNVDGEKIENKYNTEDYEDEDDEDDDTVKNTKKSNKNNEED